MQEPTDGNTGGAGVAVALLLIARAVVELACAAVDEDRVIGIQAEVDLRLRDGRQSGGRGNIGVGVRGNILDPVERCAIGRHGVDRRHDQAVAMRVGKVQVLPDLRRGGQLALVDLAPGDQHLAQVAADTVAVEADGGEVIVRANGLLLLRRLAELVGVLHPQGVDARPVGRHLLGRNVGGREVRGRGAPQVESGARGGDVVHDLRRLGRQRRRIDLEPLHDGGIEPHQHDPGDEPGRDHRDDKQPAAEHKGIRQQDEGGQNAEHGQDRPAGDAGVQVDVAAPLEAVAWRDQGGIAHQPVGAGHQQGQQCEPERDDREVGAQPAHVELRATHHLARPDVGLQRSVDAAAQVKGVEQHQSHDESPEQD